jgi:hypothetical protein
MRVTFNLKTTLTVLILFLNLIVYSQFSSNATHIYTNKNVSVGSGIPFRFDTNKFSVSGNSSFIGNIGVGISPSKEATTKLFLSTGMSGLSGLRFNDLNDRLMPSTYASKFLTVDSLGNVVLANAYVGPKFTGGENISITGTPTAGYTISSPSQVLSKIGETITLSNGGGSVTLPTSTDSQTLSLVGNELFISNGNSVNLPTNSNFDIYNDDGSLQDERTVNLNEYKLTFLDEQTNYTNKFILSSKGNVYGSAINSIKSSKFLAPNLGGGGFNSNEVSIPGSVSRIIKTEGLFKNNAWLQVGSNSRTGGWPIMNAQRWFYSESPAHYLINPLGGNVGIGLDQGNPFGTVTDPTAVLHTKGDLRFEGLKESITEPDPSTFNRVLVTNAGGDVRWTDGNDFGNGLNNVNLYNSNGLISNDLGFRGRQVNLNNNLLEFSNSTSGYPSNIRSTFSYTIDPDISGCNSYTTIGSVSRNSETGTFMLPNTNSGYFKIFGQSTGTNRSIYRGEMEKAYPIFSSTRITSLTTGVDADKSWMQSGSSSGVNKASYVWYKPMFDLCDNTALKPLVLNPLGGNVGIGLGQTVVPTANLHTKGSVRFQDLKESIIEPDPSTFNQVLVTNADGDVRWTDAKKGGFGEDISIYSVNGDLAGNRAVTMGLYELRFRMGDKMKGPSNDIKFNPNGNFYNGNSGNTFQTIESFSSLYPNLYGGGMSKYTTVDYTFDYSNQTIMTQGNYKENSWLQVSRSDCGNYYEKPIDDKTNPGVLFDLCPNPSSYLINPLGGNVGVGLDVLNPVGTVTNPTAVLHTLGNLRFQGLKAITTEKEPLTFNQVLVTNADGNVRWRDVNDFGNGTGNDGFWKLDGNTLTTGNEFLGTLNDYDLNFKRNNISAGRIGINNTSFGLNALSKMTVGTNNVAFGNDSLGVFKTGNENTTIGSQAGFNLIEGNNNIYIGNNTRATSSVQSNELNIGNWIFGKNGQIAIGSYKDLPQAFTTNNDYQLIVKKGIRTEMVRVDIADVKGWADYVFVKDYQLMPLNELEHYIKKNGHLPNIPTSLEVVKDGVDLGVMNSKLLEKVEELTLHTIELNKKNESQQKLIEDLVSRLEKIENSNKQ